MFRPGQKVKCVEACGSCGELASGSVYTVREVNDSRVSLYEAKDGGNGGWNKSRFVAADAPPVTDFVRIATEIGALVSEKQAAYGDSFGKAGAVMRILYGESIPPEKMDDALTVVRVVDKLFRIATRKDAFGESPWRDIVGYGLLAVARDEKAKP